MNSFIKNEKLLLEMSESKGDYILNNIQGIKNNELGEGTTLKPNLQ